METRQSSEKRTKSKQNQKPSTSKNCTESSKMCDDDAMVVFADETIGYILSHTPPIVERILEHLPVPLLNKCACVCKLWNSVVQAIKRRRRDVFWMFKAHASVQDDHVDPEDPKQAVYATNTSLDVGTHFYETLKYAYCEPKLGILFCTDRIVEKPKKYFQDYSVAANETGKKDRKKKKLCRSAKKTTGRLSYPVPLVEFLSKHLPSQCRLVGCVATGLVGTPVDYSGPVELEQSVGFASLLFPTIPGLECYQFSITDTDTDAFCDIGRRYRPPSVDEDGVAYITGIPKGKDVKCLLVFLEDLPEAGGLTRSVLEHYLKKQKFRIALGGAFVDRVIAPLKPDDQSRQIAVGVAFAGENVKAASLVLEPSIRKPQQVLDKLNELKACNFPKNNCVAFMFACCGRGTSFYGKHNVEAETFRKVFPDVPLFGLFGNGEIGITYLPHISTESKASFLKGDQRSSPHWFHGYTTIFILLSWGKK